MSDTPGERGVSILLVGILFLVVIVIITIYNPDWYGVADFIKEYWYIFLSGLIGVIIIYRAFQGVTVLHNLRSLSVSGGGGGGSGGGGGVLKYVLIILVIFIVINYVGGGLFGFDLTGGLGSGVSEALETGSFMALGGVIGFFAGGPFGALAGAGIGYGVEWLVSDTFGWI